MGQRLDRIPQRPQETLGDNRYVYYLDCGKGLTSVHLCKNLESCTEFTIIPQIMLKIYLGAHSTTWVVC